jgi:predicted ATPase
LDKSVPRIVVIGNMGNGKSRLLNSLSINGEFLIGDTNQAVT